MMQQLDMQTKQALRAGDTQMSHRLIARSATNFMSNLLHRLSAQLVHVVNHLQTTPWPPFRRRKTYGSLMRKFLPVSVQFRSILGTTNWCRPPEPHATAVALNAVSRLTELLLSTTYFCYIKAQQY